MSSDSYINRSNRATGADDSKNLNSVSSSNQPVHSSYSFEDFAAKFPFDHIRDNQKIVFQELADALNSGYKYVILEAPTGFGKSAEAVTTGLTLGSSYILTSTKDLQAQYQRDFPFIRTARGATNFSCLAIEDLIKNEMYGCNVCCKKSSGIHKYYVSNDHCRHTTVEYGLCVTREHGFERPEESCKYKPLNHYIVINQEDMVDPKD